MMFGGGRDFVRFVEIDDPVLCQFEIVFGLGYQFTNEVVHVRADVTRLAESGRIRFDERHADEFSDVSDEIRLADTGGVRA